MRVSTPPTHHWDAAHTLVSRTCRLISLHILVMMVGKMEDERSQGERAGVGKGLCK